MEILNFYVMPFRSSARKYSAGRVRRARKPRAGMPRRSKKMVTVYRRPRYAKPPRPLRAQWSNPLATQRKIKFHYADSGFNLTTGIGGIATSVVHCSGPYDPYVTGTGVQPYDWDTLMNTAEYAQYICYAVKITARFYFTGAPNTVICTLLASPKSSLTYTGADDLRTNPWCIQRTMNEISKGTVTMSMYVPVRKIINRDPSDFICGYNANPVAGGLAYFHTSCDSTNMAAAVSCGVDIDMDFYVKAVRLDTVNES